jgi:hypothetical protein
VRQRRLPIMPTLVAAYREWGRALIAMRAITLSAFLIMLAIAVAEELVPARLWEQQLSGEALGLVKDAVWAFLLAPVVIAVHRFVILDEITPAYTLPVGEPVFRVFFGWLFALKVFVGLPLDLLVVLQALNWSPRASTLTFAVALIAALALSLRLTILLPALAVAAPGGTASHALADSKGQVLRILLLLVLVVLPWLAVDIGGVLLLGPSAQATGTPRAMAFLVMSGVLQTSMLSLTAVVASYAFMALAAQVKRAAEPQPPA